MIKRRVTLDDSVHLFWLNGKLKDATRIGRWFLYYRILRTLSDSFIWPWQVTGKTIVKYLTAAGFLGGKPVNDGASQINELAAWIGAQLGGKTIDDVLRATTVEEVPFIYNAILSKQINDSVLSAMAHNNIEGLKNEIERMKTTIQTNKARMYDSTTKTALEYRHPRAISTTQTYHTVSDILSHRGGSDI